ncbi:uracil-DNA glycosylase [Candidatus Woesebacteria bacterium]|nr:MAG: uracil-DNA glycosylase [Candidatus Woesebacteria bacterium]
MTKKEKQKALDKLKEKMSRDEALPLRKGATNLVFGEGNSDAKVVFIGEGPGYWEDQKGRPFVGNAGAFLNQLLHSIKLPREDVFITNVVNYRPPGNRDPLPEEIAAFSPYIDKMIEIIKPKVIVTLGRFSMAKFLPGVKISDVHGKLHAVAWKGREITIVPMYHPAAGLRNGEIKRRTVEDFQKLPEILKETDKIEVEQISLV